MSSAEAPVVKRTTAVDFPVFALQWQDDSTLVASGGGGSFRSGVKNKIIIVRVENELSAADGVKGPRMDVVCEHILASDEDAPMTLAVTPKGTIVTGINQSEQIIKEKSQNKHLRVFELAPSPANKPKLVLKQQKQILPLPQPFTNEYYQRLTRFNPGGTLIAVASSLGDLSIVSFPALEPIYFTKAEDDIFSLDFSPADNDTIAYVTAKTLHILPFRDSKRIRLQNKKTFHDLHAAASKSATYETPSPGKSFRNIRFLSPTKVLATVNDRAAKRAYWAVYVLNTELGWRECKVRGMGRGIKGVTGLDVCLKRKLVAIATSDITVHIFHMDTFAALQTIDKVADFTLTQIAFSPDGKYLACSSVANSISLIPLAEGLETPSSWRDSIMEFLFYFLGLVVLVIAVQAFMLMRSRGVKA